jgi:tryptophanyl-tRNA synthetase
MTDRKVALTGIKPSGTPHLGNYLGMIRPALDLVREYDAYYFIADGHALTTVQNAGEMRELSYQAAATMLALGLDPERVVFYRQSDVPQTFELAWILSCVTPKGLLNRAHAYKASVDENVAAGRTPDDGISMGLYGYPVLMAADILIVDSHIVPVGSDQRQHVEIARDIAESFNRTFGDVLVLPEPLIEDTVATIGGLDGRKMSKSYGNVIPIFAGPKEQRKLVMKIVTDSRAPEEPKDPESDNLFRIFEHFGSPDAVASVRGRYESGGIGYGEVKSMLAESLEERFAEPLARYEELMADRAGIDELLAAGAARAGTVADDVLGRVRKAVGFSA